jgi:hypothetical protein
MSEGLTFPQSPSDGETISFSFQHTGGDANNAVTTKTWSWDGRYNAWISNSGGVVGSDRFVLKAGDTMSGNLTTTKVFRTSGDSFGPTELVTRSYVDNLSGNFVLKTGDTMSGTLTADRAFRTSGEGFLTNEFVTKSYVDAEIAGSNPSGNYVLRTGDEMSGTLTGTSASFSNSITAPSGFIGTLAGVNSSFTGLTSTNGFIGTLTGNYIDIPSLGDFGSRIRVASDQSLGMPYYSSTMNSLNLWSRLHLIGGGGPTGYSLRITNSTLGSLKDVEGRMIFDQGFTHGVAICSYGLENIDDQIAGLSIFGTNLYTGTNNQSDQTMPYQGKTASNYSGMLTLGLDGRGSIPRMFSTRRTDLENTFESNEFITKSYLDNSVVKYYNTGTDNRIYDQLLSVNYRIYPDKTFIAETYLVMTFDSGIWSTQAGYEKAHLHQFPALGAGRTIKRIYNIIPTRHFSTYPGELTTTNFLDMYVDIYSFCGQTNFNDACPDPITHFTYGIQIPAGGTYPYQGQNASLRRPVVVRFTIFGEIN